MSLSYGGKQLADAFRTVRKNTIQVAEDIPESKYDHIAAPECRSVRQMLTHVAISPRLWEDVYQKRLKTMAGFDFFGLIEKFRTEEAKPRTKVETVELLRSEGDRIAAWIETFSPELLSETLTDGDGKTVRSWFERLQGMKEHEMHHRAQLMLIERQLGIVPHLTRQFQERLAAMKAARA
jgi:uncharacterized damage-inducible protein DinB